MTALGGAESGAFTYDLNGNMIAREEGGAWYQQQFDADASGRLVAVTNTQTLSATHFVYDGDGRRIVTGHPDGSWTAFVGGHYEVDSVAAGVVSGTTVLQPGSEGQDSYVYSSYPSTNYGNSAYIYAGKVSSSQTYRGLLEFDLASIPADAVVDQATLTLFCRKLSTASATLYLYRVTKGWGESSVTWNSQPATGSQVEGTLNLATSRYQAKEVDLTALVQAWVEGSQVNQGVMVKEGGSTAYGQCYSSDGTVGFRPKLEVHWHQPPPQPATRSYYYLGSRRIAMQVDDGVESAVYYFHTDHLGSTSAMSNESGTLVEGSVTRYLPYGGYRTAPGANLTDHGFTGHKHNSYIKLVDMKARWYSPQLGRFIQPDKIIPDPSNPQDLNRYSYVRNSPVKYRDPTGRFPWLAVISSAYLFARTTYEVITTVAPGGDQFRRDYLGGGLVTELSDVIASQSAAHSVDPTLVSAVLRHESAAFERRLLTPLPAMQPGLIASGAEYAQSMFQGDTASIGPGQMQLRRAQELEQMGYVTARSNDHERRLALLGEQTSVEYVAGMLHFLSDQLNTVDGYSDLSAENQQRLLLIAYNWGWTGDFMRRLEEWGPERLAEEYQYDNETLDEYLRWSQEQ